MASQELPRRQRTYIHTYTACIHTYLLIPHLVRWPLKSHDEGINQLKVVPYNPNMEHTLKLPRNLSLASRLIMMKLQCNSSTIASAVTGMCTFLDSDNIHMRFESVQAHMSSFKQLLANELAEIRTDVAPTVSHEAKSRGNLRKKVPWVLGRAANAETNKDSEFTGQMISNGAGSIRVPVLFRWMRGTQNQEK